MNRVTLIAPQLQFNVRSIRRPFAIVRSECCLYSNISEVRKKKEKRKKKKRNEKMQNVGVAHTNRGPIVVSCPEKTMYLGISTPFTKACILLINSVANDPSLSHKILAQRN